MMRFICAVVIVASCAAAEGQVPSRFQQRADLAAYPCGPNWILGADRLLIPQEWYGANFRPACNKHDACVRIPGQSRFQCDRRFWRDIRSECRYSARPQECRRVAGAMYLVSRFFGGRELSPATRSWGINKLRRVNASYGRNAYPSVVPSPSFCIQVGNSTDGEFTKR